MDGTHAWAGRVRVIGILVINSPKCFFSVDNGEA